MVRRERDGNVSYHARISVPDDLRAVIGKTQLWGALSGDYQEALRLLPSVIVQLQAQLDRARTQAKASTVITPGNIRRVGSIRAAAMALYAEQLREDDNLRFKGVDVAAQHEIFAGPYEVKLRGVVAGVASDEETAALIGWAIEEAKPGLAYGTPQWRQWAKELATAQVRVMERQRERDKGDYSGPTILPSPPEEEATRPARAISEDSHKTLDDLLPGFLAEKKPAPGTRHEYEVSARMITEFLGERAVHSITKQDAISYKNALVKTPSNYTKRFKGKTLPEAIELNAKRKEPFPVLSLKTIGEKWLQRASSYMQWLVSNGVIPDNPFAGVKVEASRSTTTPPRVHFASEDLAKIFSAPLFAKRSDLEERQWSLLIALHTGMRASEIAQLRLDSIRREHGVLVFSVEEMTKNVESRREVPVHSTLIELGLEQRIADLRKAGHDRLFPDWHQRGLDMIANAGEGRAVNQPFSQVIPRWFNRTYLAKLGITDTRKTYHSFRHTMKTALKRAGVGREYSDAITGHDDQSSGSGYIHDGGIEKLKEEIEKIRLDGFDLKHLYVQ